VNKDISVTVFIRDMDIGGAQNQSILLVKYLSRYHSTQLVVYYKKGGYLTRVEKENLNITFLEGNHISKFVYLYNIFKKGNKNILFNMLPINNVIGGIIGKFAGVSKIYGGIRTDNINNNNLYFHFKLIIQRLICNYVVDGFISNSYSAKDSYERYGFSVNKLLVIHNIIDRNNVISKHKNDNYVNILSIGRMVPQKNYLFAIDVIKYLIDKKPEIRRKIKYYIIGYGKQENNIREYIYENDLDGVVYIINANEDLSAWYSRSDIYFMTSTYEGTPNSLIEAIMYELPVVSSDVGDVKYFIKMSESGYYWHVNNLVNFSDSLYGLIIDAKKRKSMGECGRKHIYSNYSPEETVQKYINLIDNEI
jgi:glycosyltransferase involved in cell wall biosynthesis